LRVFCRLGDFPPHGPPPRLLLTRVKARNSSAAEAQVSLTPKAGAAIDGMQLMAIALVGTEDMLRNTVEKHPLGMVAVCLMLGAAVGLLSLVKPGADAP